MCQDLYQVPTVKFNELFGDGGKHGLHEQVKHALSQRGFLLIEDLPSQVVCELNSATDEANHFFEDPKRKSMILDPRLARSKNGLPPAWGCGYNVRKTDYIIREQFHVLVGREAEMPWRNAEMRKALNTWAKRLESIGLVLFEILGFDSSEIMDFTKDDTPDGYFHLNDASVFDAFKYFNQHGESKTENMSAHTDPGIFTIKSVSTTRGLQVLDHQSGLWFDADQPRFKNSLVVFNCDTLETLSHGAYKSSSHKVCAAEGSRLSLVYELRTTSC